MSEIIDLYKDDYTVIYGTGGGDAPDPPIEEDDTLISRQTLRVLMAVSEGQIADITDVYLDRSNIANYKKITKEIQYGIAGQTYCKGFSEVETPHPSNAPVQLFNSAPITKTVSSINIDAVRITLQFASVTKVDSGGNIRGYEATHRVSTRKQNGNWQVQKTSKISGKSSGPWAYDIRVERPDDAEGSLWEIKVERVSPDDASSKEKSMASWSSTIEIQDHKETYPYTALLAITAKNARRLGGNFPSIMARVKGIKVKVPTSVHYNWDTKVYTGTPWDGTFDGVFRYTSNPSWLLYNILTNTRYGCGISENDINKFSFFEFAKYCDQKVDIIDENDVVIGQECRYEIHNQFIEREESRTFLEYFLSITNSHFSTDSFGNLTIEYDCVRNPSKFENNSSVIDGVFEYSSSDIEERYTRVNVTYNNANDFGNTDTVTWPDESPTTFETDLVAKYGDNVIDIPLVGCMSKGQAIRKAKWMFYTSCVCTQIVSFRKFATGNFYKVGEVLEILDDANYLIKQQGITLAYDIVPETVGHIKLDRFLFNLNDITKIGYYTSDGFVTKTITGWFENDDNTASIVISDDDIIGLTPVTDSPFVLYGAINPTTWKVSSITYEEDSKIYTITAMQYDENKFSYVDSGVYVKPDTFIDIKNLQTPPVSNVTVQEHFYKDGINSKANLLISWDWTYATIAQVGDDNWAQVSTLLSFNALPFIDDTAQTITTNGPISLSTDIVKFGSGAFHKKDRESDIYWHNTVLYLPFNGTFEDEKRKTVTNNNNVTISSVKSVFGEFSALFSGSNYLSLANHSHFNFANVNFTIEFWVNFSSLPGAGSFANLLSKRGSATTNYSYIFFYSGTGSINLSVSYNGTSLGVNTSYGITPTIGIWYHVAAVRNGTSLDIYVNGVKGTTGNIGTNSIFTASTEPLKIGTGDFNTNYFNGYMDSLRITYGVARYVSNFTVVVHTDPCYSYMSLSRTALATNDFTVESNVYIPLTTEDIYPDSVVLFLPMDGEDNSTLINDVTGKTITRNGNVSLRTSTKVYGSSSAYFDGTGDYLDTSTSTDFTFGTGDFTVEFWMNPFVVKANTNIIFETRPANTNGAYLTCLITSNGALSIYANTADRIISSNGVIIAGNWYHIAVCRKNGVTKLYINGIKHGNSYTDSTNYAMNYVRLGRSAFAAAQPTEDFNGYIDSVRVTKGVARYTSDFEITPGLYGIPSSYDVYWDNVSLLLDMNGVNNGTSFIDAKDKTITVAGNAVTKTDNKKYGVSSGYFDGNGDYLTIANHADFNFGTGDFTIELWVRFTGGLGGFQMFYDDETVTDYGILFETDTFNKVVFLYMPSNLNSTLSTNLVTLQSSTVVGLNTWYHIAAVRYGTSIKLYINGVSEASATLSAGVGIYQPGGTKSIGYRANGASRAYLNGYLDSFRITKGIARYTGNFNPEQSFHYAHVVPDPYWNETVLLMSMTGNDNGTSFIDIEGKTITPSGNAVTKTNIKKFGASSAYFDGNGDFLSTPSHTDFHFGTGDFTIECWVYPTSYPGGAVTKDLTIFATWTGSTGFIWHLDRITGKSTFWNNTFGVQSTNPVPLNTWSHVAVSRVSSTLYLFINGVLEATSPSYTFNFNMASTYRIGGNWLGDNARFFVGYIDEFRITKGIGRYSSTFTPSPTPFSRKRASGFPIFNCQNDLVDASGFRVGYHSVARTLYFIIGNGSSEVITYGSSIVPLKEWIHVAFVRAGGTIKGYLNGKLEFSISNTSNFSRNSWMIGINPKFHKTLEFILDELRITNGFARYNSNFTPPVTEFLANAPVTENTDIAYNASYTLYYRRDQDNYTEIKDIGNKFYEIENALPGVYDIILYANNLFSLKSDPVTTVYNYKTGAIGSSTLLSPINLYVEDTTDTVFTTRNCSIVWEANPGNDSVSDRLLDYVVETWTSDGITKKGTYFVKPEDIYGVHTALDAGRFTYTYEQNDTDFINAQRTFQIRVYARDIGGKLSSPTVANFTNPAPATASGVVSFGTETLFVNIVPIGDKDLEGYAVYIDTVSGFTPSDGNLVYIGKSNWISLSLSNATYYIKFAGYDAFGRNGLNYSSEYSGQLLGVVVTWNFTGLTFKPNDPTTNKVSWTAGGAYNSQGQSFTISASNATWTSDILYIYYIAGNTTLSTTTDLSVAVSTGVRILATYEGGTLLTVGGGNAFISGDKILVGTIGSNALVTNTAVITNSAQIANGIITNAKIDGIISSTNYDPGIAGWMIDKNGSAEFNGNVIVNGTLDVSKIMSGTLEKITNLSLGTEFNVERAIVTSIFDTPGYYTYTCNNDAGTSIVIELSVSFDCPETTNYVHFSITDTSNNVLSAGDFYNRSGSEIACKYFYGRRVVTVTVPSNTTLRFKIDVAFRNTDVSQYRDFSDIFVTISERYK